VLTARSPHARSFTRDNTAALSKFDAKNAQAIEIIDDRYGGKHLYSSAFRNSRMTRSMRVQTVRCWSAASENLVRGL
jgi:hypothetical protein